MERQRLDKWLWHARVVKARTSAAALIEAGHVRVNGAREKAPGHSVKLGDVVTIGLDRTVRILKVAGFAERRGDATAARVLYDDLQSGRNNYLRLGRIPTNLNISFCRFRRPALPLRREVPALRNTQN